MTLPTWVQNNRANAHTARAANPELARQKDREYREKNYEATRARQNAWRAANRERINAERGPKRVARERARREAAAGRLCPELCELCGRPPGPRARLQFDHDHSCCSGPKSGCTMCFRGWLCIPCNTFLARFDENPDMLSRLNFYLGRS